MSFIQGVSSMAYAVPVIVVALVLMQGGFFPIASCVWGGIACALAAVVCLTKNRRKEPVPVISVLFFAFCLTCFVSALVNGATLTTVAKAASWTGLVGITLIVGGFDDTQQTRMLTVFGWLGVAAAAAGIVVYGVPGLVALGVDTGRLQFTFQYANAAGIWYGASTLFCLLSDDERQAKLAYLSAAAMLLTQSGGALVSFALVVAVLAARMIKAGTFEKLSCALMQACFALILFVPLRALQNPIGLALAVALAVAFYLFQDRIADATVRANARRASLVLAAVLLLALAVGAILLRGRVAEAAGTLLERFSQMKDALALWATSPVLGIGPNNWQYLYPYHQTAAYYSSVVHSSYLQILLDAGLVGFALFVAALVVGVKGLAARGLAKRDRPFVPLYVVALILIHCLIDFDLYFASIAYLLVALLSLGRARKARVNGIAAAIVSLLVCVPLSVIGYTHAFSSAALIGANEVGEHEYCIRAFESSPVVSRDAAAQEEYLRALYELDAYESVVAAYRKMDAPTAGSTAYAALSLFAQGRGEEASQLLVERLEGEPFNTTLLQNAETLFSEYGIDPSWEARFENVKQQIG